MIVDSELIFNKDCDCTGRCECENYCVPIIREAQAGPDPGTFSTTQMLEVKQRKGETEMAVADWLVYPKDNVVDGDTVVCLVTSGDINAIYIYILML